MSTLEKFGILVILILVTIIGVVAVWGVGGEEGMNPFDPAGGGDVAVVPQQEPGPSSELPPWPSNPGPVAPAPVPVEPPAIVAPVTPPGGGLAVRPSVDPVPPPSPGTGSVYVVKKGDTYTRIASAVWGDGTRWREIADANPDKPANRLKIGDTIRIPSRGGVAVAPAPDRPMVRSFAGPNPDDGPTVLPAAAALREVEVRAGDSWYSLSVTHMGDGTKWKKLMGANPGIGERDLRPGMRVKLPAAE